MRCIKVLLIVFLLEKPMLPRLRSISFCHYPLLKVQETCKKGYMETKALVQCFGKPDIVLKMACNPTWKEISNELGPHEKVHNHLDLVAYVFHAKLEELKI